MYTHSVFSTVNKAWQAAATTKHPKFLVANVSAGPIMSLMTPYLKVVQLTFHPRQYISVCSALGSLRSLEVLSMLPQATAVEHKYYNPAFTFLPPGITRLSLQLGARFYTGQIKPLHSLRRQLSCLQHLRHLQVSWVGGEVFELDQSHFTYHELKTFRMSFDGQVNVRSLPRRTWIYLPVKVKNVGNSMIDRHVHLCKQPLSTRSEMISVKMDQFFSSLWVVAV